MRRILVATDLSSRADRAMRRAAIAAAAHGAELLILYAVDDDQPAAIVEATRREAAALLARAADGLPELRGLATRTLVEAGDRGEPTRPAPFLAGEQPAGDRPDTAIVNATAGLRIPLHRGLPVMTLARPGRQLVAGHGRQMQARSPRDGGQVRAGDEPDAGSQNRPASRSPGNFK